MVKHSHFDEKLLSWKALAILDEINMILSHFAWALCMQVASACWHFCIWWHDKRLLKQLSSEFLGPWMFSLYGMVHTSLVITVPLMAVLCITSPHQWWGWCWWLWLCWELLMFSRRGMWWWQWRCLRWRWKKSCATMTCCDFLLPDYYLQIPSRVHLGSYICLGFTHPWGSYKRIEWFSIVLQIMLLFQSKVIALQLLSFCISLIYLPIYIKCLGTAAGLASGFGAITAFRSSAFPFLGFIHALASRYPPVYRLTASW